MVGMLCLQSREKRHEQGASQVVCTGAHGGMGSVALLPEEFKGADEGPRAQLPAVHIRPLVEQHGQIAVGLDPLRQHVVHHRL